MTEPHDEDAETAARRVAARVLAGVPDLVRELVDEEFRATAPFGELPDDVREVEIAWTTRLALVGFLERAARGEPALPVDRAPFAERAAQRAEEGVPLDAVVRTYLGGARRLARELWGRAEPTELPGVALLTERLLTVIDDLTEGVIRGYLAEYEELRADGRAAQQALARALVDGRSIGTLADELGIELADRYVVLCLRIEAGAGGGAGEGMVRRRRNRRVRAALGRFAQGTLLALMSSRDNGGLVLLPGAYEADALRGLGPVLGRAAQAPVLVGHAAAEGRDAVPAAVRRAEAVARTVRETGRPPGVYGLNDVLVDYHLAQPRDGDTDVAALLDPLRVHPELRATLAAYLAADRDRRRAAADLGVHPNTVDKRVTRAAALTGVDPHSTSGIVLLSAALAVTVSPPPDGPR
ncbi:helix-turn-helix domain-containing protein [Streptomyces sp. NPDC051684]|uniref:helix-turn-helix domain-containing protein n=1 Tax=Streptomyces sp. NPDC051684 TaxID=3365670 RepID=UPI00379B959F